MSRKTFARSITIAVAVVVGVAAMALATTKKPSNPANSPKLVELRLTFADGGWAEVHQAEGQMLTIHENGKTLGITPYIRSMSQKQVDLSIFRIEEKSGTQTATPVATCSLTDAPAILKDVISPVSVEFKEFETASIQPGGQNCCARDCSGRLICAFCVCTKCGVCGPCLCIPINL